MQVWFRYILAFRLRAELHRLKGLSQPFSLHCTHGSWPKPDVLNLFALVYCLCLVCPWCAALKKHSPSFHRSYRGGVRRNLQVVFQTDMAVAEPCSEPRMICALLWLTAASASPDLVALPHDVSHRVTVC